MRKQDITMTLTRLLPLQFHAVLEALMAPAMIAVPFLLGFEAMALIGAVLIGALMMGSAFHVSGKSPRVSAHQGLDMLVTTLTGSLAIGLALSGDAAAA